ncbi:MAG TPA: toll/interleukin-1 receptor domain-containing protein [Pyrinomonadaceae bacterium]|jgi:hypothetical protein|nr:toll/interleukin-1 receptor domain-containing protein [Pyrinomonadaceae bacterium]
MANPKHLQILKQGFIAWNDWRDEHRKVRPDLAGADLVGKDLNFLDLSGADLSGADLNGANLLHANLSDANLSGSFLTFTNLSQASLGGADFTGAVLGYTTFADSDLSEVKGLETVRHFGSSSIGVDTLYKSAGKIPEAFLRGCGVPDDFIAFIPSHFGVQQAIQFYSCFISYSTRDEEFARRLYSRMRDEKLRVWFAPEEMKGGQKLYEQIERAIQLHDRLLLVLSESSMQSEWVMNEIQRARETELKEGRRKLFPISIVEFHKVKAWRRFDADSGRDLAKEVREYFIPDFSDWKDHDAFEKAFERLLRDLRAEEARA